MRASVAGREIRARARRGGRRWSGAGASGPGAGGCPTFVLRRRPPRGGRHFCVNAGPSASPRTPTAGDSPTSPARRAPSAAPRRSAGVASAETKRWTCIVIHHSATDYGGASLRHRPQGEGVGRAGIPLRHRQRQRHQGRARRGGPPLERRAALTAAAPRTTTSTELASASSETSTRTAPPTRSRPT